MTEKKFVILVFYFLFRGWGWNEGINIDFNREIINEIIINVIEISLEIRPSNACYMKY